MKRRALVMAALLVLGPAACRKKNNRPERASAADWGEQSLMPEPVPWWAFWHMFGSPSEPATQHYRHEQSTPVMVRPPPARSYTPERTQAQPSPRYNTPAPATPRYNQPSSSPPSSTPRYNSGGSSGGGTRYNSNRR